MAKTKKSVRLDQELIDSAAQTALKEARSTTEQIEYWARAGRAVSRILQPAEISGILAGKVTLKVEVDLDSNPAINPDSVFSAVESARNSGDLSNLVSKAAVRYQSSVTRPGCIERIDTEGKKTIGSFHDGKFIPHETEE
ncbi:hypothetical protein [Microbulbifer sp. HZ11]|uniref:TA system antitoxin ParD family protein n=1 Tax=Microbulbifer sp. HZ11 TaxID=1453501 RepID=UPI0005BA0A68|nr:hypothetical protein [Microbulbifer sp. HZ11]